MRCNQILPPSQPTSDDDDMMVVFGIRYLDDYSEGDHDKDGDGGDMMMVMMAMMMIMTIRCWWLMIIVRVRMVEREWMVMTMMMVLMIMMVLMMMIMLVIIVMMEMIDDYNDGDDGDDVPVMLMMHCNQIFFPSPPCSPQLHPIYRDTRKLHFSGFQSFFTLLSGTIFQYLLVLVAH